MKYYIGRRPGKEPIYIVVDSLPLPMCSMYEHPTCAHWSNENIERVNRMRAAYGKPMEMLVQITDEEAAVLRLQGKMCLYEK